MKFTKTHGYIFGILGCLLWSTAFAGVKIGYTYLDSPFIFAGLRFTLAGIILIPFTWRGDFFSLIKKNFDVILTVVILNTALGYALYYTGLRYVDGAIAAIIIGSGPIITGVMSHFLMKNDRFTKFKILSLILGLLGISIIVFSTKSSSSFGSKSLLGVVLMLLNSTLTSYANIKVAQMKTSINGPFLTSNQMFFGGILLLILGAVFEGVPSLNLPIAFYLSLIWLALVSAIAFSLWFIALQIKGMKVSELNMLKFLVPVLGAVISWILLPNEYPTPGVLLGMVFVIGSLFVYRMDNR